MRNRGRVPFALVGVVLLVSSGTLAVSMHDPLATDPAVDEGMDRLTAESHTALRVAIREAARASARDPVVVAANSTTGDALGESRPFEDALRLRIYLAARDHLSRLQTRRRGVNLSASLPPIRDPTDARAAIERVHLEPGGPDGRALAVRIEDLRLRARTDGRLAGETRLQPELVVETPVLVVHDGIERFERRLNAGVGSPGLASRLTAVLYPVAWARGYAQFRGGAIENVLANRHVALATNGAVLAEQRVGFGASDPVGRRVYGRTLAETGVTDLVRVTNASAVERLDRLATATGLRESPNESLPRLEPGAGAPRPSETVTVSVDRTADLAYARAVRALDETLAATYRPAGRVRADVRTIERRRVDSHDPPEVAGGVVGVHRTYDTTVHGRSGSPLPPADGWHRLANYSRRVTVEERTVRRWSMPGNATATTSGTVEFERAVDLLVAGNHTVGPAPDGPIETVHRRGGPLDGPNLADAPDLIRSRIVEGRGGPDALAARAALGRLDTEPVFVDAARPDGLAEWVRPDVSGLHDRVREASVEVPRGEIATFRANVPARLATRLGDRREDLVDAPESYGSVAERARVGVRAAYVDRVLAMLEARALQHRNGRERIGEELPSPSADPATLLRDGYDARRGVGSGSPPPVRMAVDAAPSYLTVEAVDHETVPAVAAGRPEHPLVARNVNAFSLPTTGVVDALFGLLDGPDTTSVRSAAQVLRVAAEGGLDRTGAFQPGTVLESEVSRSADGIEAAIHRVLRRNDLGPSSARERVVESALGRWDDTGAEAAALANGSAADAVYEAALSRWPDRLETAHARKRLAIELDFAAVDAKSSELIRPTEATVERAANRSRALFGTVPSDLGRRATRAAGGRFEELATERAAALAARLPRGVPVVPAPGMWYATVNAWHVHVRGSYARFVVRAPNGAPDRSPPTLAYVREAAPVRLDVDGDGRRELLGENRRIEFDSETVVAVAVPPQPQGVGDVTERDERSPGWPDPGPAE